MREILFRTWDGHKMITDGLVICNGDLYMDWRDFENGITSDNPLMQYTGFKDKNGVKIFEGDVVKGRYSLGFDSPRVIGVVEYVAVGFVVKGVKQYSLLQKELNRNFEVIGNIHDNPEMMEERP